MTLFKKILVPVDLSEFNRDSIALASNLAKANNARLVFCYVALPPLPPEALYVKDELDELLASERQQFSQIQPDDKSVAYERVFLQGNPGPDILRIADDQGCDLIVLATHGRTGVLRWLMGSVAEYVTRHAKCPVLTLRMPNKSAWANKPEPQPQKETGETEAVAEKMANPEPSAELQNTTSPYITSAMQHSPPIHAYDSISRVADELEETQTTAAPVVDEFGKCIGVLTNSDIEKYHQLQNRLASKDESVLDEIYETDEFGMRRTNNATFDLVKRHMTVPVVVIDAKATCQDAQQLLAQHAGIHHLIVVDSDAHPLGVVESEILEPDRVSR